MTTHTVCEPISCGPVLQQPSRKKPVVGATEQVCSGSPNTFFSGARSFSNISCKGLPPDFCLSAILCLSAKRMPEFATAVESVRAAGGARGCRKDLAAHLFQYRNNECSNWRVAYHVRACSNWLDVPISRRDWRCRKVRIGCRNRPRKRFPRQLQASFTPGANSIAQESAKSRYVQRRKSKVLFAMAISECGRATSLAPVSPTKRPSHPEMPLPRW